MRRNQHQPGTFWANVHEIVAVIRILRPTWVRRASMLLVTAGISLMTVDWWLPIVNEVLGFAFDRPPSGFDAFVQGLVLILLGLAFYTMHDLIEQNRRAADRLAELEDASALAWFAKQPVASIAEPLENFMRHHSYRGARGRLQQLLSSLSAMVPKVQTQTRRRLLATIASDAADLQRSLEQLEENPVLENEASIMVL